MSPSGGDRKQVRRRAAAPKERSKRLGQVVEIQFLRPEDARDLRRLRREGSRSLQAVVGIGIGPCLAAVSHGRVRFDTHNDLRLAVDALSGGPYSATFRLHLCSCYLHGWACGFYGDATRECRCTGGIIQRYLSKISGPLLDRIDRHIEAPALAYKEMRGAGTGTSSEEIRGRVEGPRAIQRARGYYNSRIPTRMLRRLCELADAGERTLETAVRRLGLSARAHHRILKEKENVP